MKRVLASIAATAAMLICTSCFWGKSGPEATYGPGHYETAWVDPELIVSDSLMTLIRSDRIDRIYIPDKEKKVGTRQPDVEFKVDKDFCTVEADLIVKGGTVIEPLFHGTLRPGNYKMTVNISMVSPAVRKQGLAVAADFCGDRKTFQLSDSN